MISSGFGHYLRVTPIGAQLSPEIFDPRKMDSNFLEPNFGYFRLSTVRDDKDKNYPSNLLIFGLKSSLILF